MEAKLELLRRTMDARSLEFLNLGKPATLMNQHVLGCMNDGKPHQRCQSCCEVAEQSGRGRRLRFPAASKKGRLCHRLLA